MPLKIEPMRAGLRISLKVVPGSSRDRIVGPLGDALKVAVSAPPEGGKANAAVIKLLAERLGIAPGNISIQGGHSSPRKTVLIQGVDENTLRASLDE